jgi:hypothetical protein
MANDGQTRFDRFLSRAKNAPVLWQILAFVVVLWSFAELISTLVSAKTDVEKILAAEQSRSHLEQHMIDQLLSMTKDVDQLFAALPSGLEETRYEEYREQYAIAIGNIRSLRRLYAGYLSIFPELELPFDELPQARQEETGGDREFESPSRGDPELEATTSGAIGFEAPVGPIQVDQDVQEIVPLPSGVSPKLYAKVLALSIIDTTLSSLEKNIKMMQEVHRDQGFVSPEYRELFESASDIVLSQGLLVIFAEEAPSEDGLFSALFGWMARQVSSVEN